jgi:aspartate kinase
MDYLQSFGENLSSIIMKYALNSVGLKSKYMTGGECGILTDNNYGDAKPLIEASRTQIAARLNPLIKEGTIPVVAGFTGQTQEGDTTTLGRGGADYTATVIASALGADEVCIWSGVDGLMTADPEIEPKAQVIPKISYQEALEMAYFGATILHPRALEPAEELDIPVRIQNLFKPDSEGTLITLHQKGTAKDVAKAVTIIRDVALIFIGGAGMVGAPAVSAKAFNALNKRGLHVLMISQGSSQSNISLIVPRNEMEKAVSALELTLTGTNYISNVSYEVDLCVIAAVGEGMKGTPGVAARVFKAIAEKGINVRMIAQGSSETNISFVVKENDGEEAIRALHNEFKLNSSS